MYVVISKLIYPEYREYCTILVDIQRIKDVHYRVLEVLSKQYPKSDIDITEVYEAWGTEEVLYHISEDIGIVEIYNPESERG